MRGPKIWTEFSINKEEIELIILSMEPVAKGLK